MRPIPAAHRLRSARLRGVHSLPSSGRAAGPVVHCWHARNHCIANASALERNVWPRRIVDGHRVQFAGADTRVPRGRFEVPLDARVLFTAANGTFTGAGRVGVRTRADAPIAARDPVRRILLARGLRDFGDGLAAVLLPAYLVVSVVLIPPAWVADAFLLLDR